MKAEGGTLRGLDAAGESLERKRRIATAFLFAVCAGSITRRVGPSA